MHCSGTKDTKMANKNDVHKLNINYIDFPLFLLYVYVLIPDLYECVCVCVCHTYVFFCNMSCNTCSQCSGDMVCIFLLSTYTDGRPPDSTTWFCRWVADTASDFRVDKSLLSSVHYAVFALGNSLYTQHYNTAGRELYQHLQQLSAQPVYPLGLGDQNVAQSKYGGKVAF